MDAVAKGEWAGFEAGLVSAAVDELLVAPKGEDVADVAPNMLADGFPKRLFADSAGGAPNVGGGVPFGVPPLDGFPKGLFAGFAESPFDAPEGIPKGLLADFAEGAPNAAGGVPFSVPPFDALEGFPNTLVSGLVEDGCDGAPNGLRGGVPLGVVEGAPNMLELGVIVACEGAPNGLGLGASCFEAKGLTAGADGAPKADTGIFAVSNGFLGAVDGAPKGFILSSVGETTVGESVMVESANRTCLVLM